MDDIIHQILDIDARAQEKLRQAYEEQERKQAQTDKEIAAMKQAEYDRLQDKVRQARDSRRQQEEKEIGKIREQAAFAIRNLTEQFKSREDEWTRQIVDSVING